MVYKKYVVKNGKRYGPYIYHSRRINGKVISEYHGQEKKFPKKIISILIIAFFLGGIIFLASLFKQNLSGNAIFGVEGEIQNGTVSSGRINFFLNEGELIPVNSTVKIINNEDTYEYSLEDFLGKSETFFGSFGLKDLKFSGEGEGYGLVGKKETFPLITFEVILKDKEKNEEGDLHFEKNGKETLTPPSEENVEKVEEIEGVNATEQSAEVNHSTVGIEVIPEIAEETFLEEKESLVEDNASSENAETELITETFSEPTAEETVLNEETTSVSEETNADVEIVQAEEKSAETNDETTTETEESGEEPDGETPLTGNFISVLANSISNLFAGLMTGRVTDSPKVIEGQVSKNSPFEFQNNGKIPEIVDGSIKISGEPVSANLLYLENFGNKTFVKTNYSVFEEGFGEGFFGIETKKFSIDLADLGMNLSEGNLQILLLYKDEELFSFSKKISNENLRNESERVPEEIINNSINLSTNAMAEEFNLTDFERAKIVFATNASEVNTIVSKYKNRFLVEFTLGNYKIEHSYSGSLSEEVLRNEIEIDKELWLKDILGSLNEEKSYKEPFENLDASYSL